MRILTQPVVSYRRHLSGRRRTRGTRVDAYCVRGVFGFFSSFSSLFWVFIFGLYLFQHGVDAVCSSGRLVGSFCYLWCVCILPPLFSVSCLHHLTVDIINDIKTLWYLLPYFIHFYSSSLFVCFPCGLEEHCLSLLANPLVCESGMFWRALRMVPGSAICYAERGRMFIECSLLAVFAGYP